MIPCLYSATETAFSTNGIGKLADCISCQVTEKRNSSYELKLTYPTDGIHADSLQKGCVIVAKPSVAAEPQPFRIYKVVTNATGTLEVAARHVSYQLNYITASTVYGASCLSAILSLKTNATTTCDFTFSTDIESDTALSISEPNSLRNCLGGIDGSILDTYGGEFEWDWYNVILHKARGSDNNVRIVYGKNLVDLTMTEDAGDVITGVHPFWKGMDGDDEVYVELPEKLVLAEGATEYRIRVLDCSTAFEEQPTEEELRTYAESYLESTSYTTPDVDIEINFAQLWQTPDYAGIAAAEQVSLCDTVHVYIAKLGLEVSSKVTETVYDTLLERYESITLSNSTVVSSRSLVSTIDNLMAASAAALEAKQTQRYETLYASIQTLAAGAITAETVRAIIADFDYVAADELNAAVAELGYLTATQIAASYVQTDNLSAAVAELGYLTSTQIAAKYVTSDYLASNYITASVIKSTYAAITDLNTNYLTTAQLKAQYATVDLANVAVADVGTLFANVGLLTNMTVVDGSVTGTLNGVTINADVITTGTLSVDRLLLTGEGGIVYAINASSSGLTETELSEEQYQNYINGTCIVTQSITANQIAAEAITGDKIAASTITASNLAVTELSAITGNVGELTSGILKSQNYNADEGTGLLIDLNTGTIYYDALTALSTSVSNNTLLINQLTSTANSLVASVSAISVGGRNYALTSGNYTENSDLSNWVWYPTDYSANVSLAACDGYVRLEKINSSSGIYGLWLKLSDAVDFQTDEKYTITVKYRLSTDWEIVLYAGSVLADGGLSLTSLGSSIGDGDGVDEWAVASFTGVPYDYYSSDAVTRYIGFYIPNIENGDTFDIAYIKFEKGTMSTDWTPAPEDTDSAVEAVSASLALTIEDETDSDSETTHVAKLSANADRIELTSGQLVLSSDNFSLAADGTIVATNGTFTGKITATSGTIGGFTIGSSAIYNSKTSLSSTASGVYVGTDGISLGSTFSVTKAGVITAKSGTIGPLTISNSSNTDANSGHTYASSLFVQQYGTSVTVWDATTDDSTVSTTVDAEFGIKATGSSLTALNQYLIWKKSGDAWSNAIIPYSVTGWGKVKCSGIDIYPTRAIYADGDGDLTYCDSELRCIYTGTYYAYLNLCKIVNDIDPASTNTYDFGGSSYRYRRIYVNTVYRSSEESLSDRKLKQNVKPLTEDYEQLIMGLTAVEYDFINGDSHRKHMGFIAQDVRDTALATVGDLSLFSASVIGDDHAEYSEELPDEQLQWYLSYEELIAPLVAMVQHQQRRIERLETALAAITKEESSC